MHRLLKRRNDFPAAVTIILFVQQIPMNFMFLIWRLIKNGCIVVTSKCRIQAHKDATIYEGNIFLVTFIALFDKIKNVKFLHTMLSWNVKNSPISPPYYLLPLDVEWVYRVTLILCLFNIYSHLRDGRKHGVSYVSDGTH